MTSNVKISVIIPVYNAADFLPRTVGSILMQDFDDFEVIIINDGSTDGSATVCDEMAEQDARVRVIHKENGGVSSARNAGLDAARGEFVMFVDADQHLAYQVINSRPHFLSTNQNAAGFGAVSGISIPKFHNFLHLQTHITGGSSLSDLPDTAIFQHIAQHRLHGGGTHIGQHLADLRLAHGHQAVQHRGFDAAPLADLPAVDHGEAAVQLLVAHV